MMRVLCVCLHVRLHVLFRELRVVGGGWMDVQRAGFRRLWVSYRPAMGEVESFSIYLVEPDTKHPLWLKFSGFFTILDEPVP